LKQYIGGMENLAHESPPARGRGLKQCGGQVVVGRVLVAPCAGAWIETTLTVSLWPDSLVAPCAGAWIETYSPGEK